MAAPLVLIVDDNEKNRKLARDVLEFSGYGTLEATGGIEGVALAQEHLPDLVLMDIRMPDRLRRLPAEADQCARVPRPGAQLPAPVR
jgi:CheY-like chemotaxis protein